MKFDMTKLFLDSFLLDQEKLFHDRGIIMFLEMNQKITLMLGLRSIAPQNTPLT